MIQDSIFNSIHSTDVKERTINGCDAVCRPRATDYLTDKVTACAEFKVPAEPTDRLVAKNEPECLGAELLRTLASRLSQAQARHPLKKLLVTSAVQGEGKTLISANLSITLAMYSKRVLLIDGDLRSSGMSRWFDVVDNSSMQTWCDQGIYRAPLLRKAEGLPLWVFPAGIPVEVPGSILQSPEFAAKLDELEDNFDWVIIDSPPLVPFADAGILAALADAVLLVTRRGVTSKPMLEEALGALDRQKIIVTILNSANVQSQKCYDSYYSEHQRVVSDSWGIKKTKSKMLSLK
ncbi:MULTISPECIES: CpsD/CapB family tyrosine-protein kinase [Acidobacteriaceae]|uniref:tyrosine-protein kinase family protein n=1 Tax=Acidobacteriaceae TaxID=204434 RepID=UPI00131DF6D5|nr:MULTISPECIES: CpsD/CapB family tyrosine-protein kinase [Acidobacteriaceae]MDW5265939.1 CpsD/CapB family tyrosine-protein kinase [Edaphobacter sp.]